jgi:Sec7-like guanine-nucleotide exchange factor
MVRAGEAMIKQSARRNSTLFVRNSSLQTDEACAKPMFDIVWPPVVGVLSQLLETYEDPGMVQLCLNGFRDSIRIACRLDFGVARNTFINVLLKFTTLDTVKEMKPKHVACIKLLMDVALAEGDFLEESWLQVLQSVSRLSRLQLLASGAHTDDIFFSDVSLFDEFGVCCGAALLSNCVWLVVPTL